jgi:hypothetical protein
MLTSIKKYFQKPTLQERFPAKTFTDYDPSTTRKVGLSTHMLYPLQLYRQVENYFESLHPSSSRYKFLKKWIKLIHSELLDLSKYDLENIGKIVIIQNDKAIFDFYLIYDIHIRDIETIVIDLDQAIERPGYYSYFLGSMTFVASLSGISFLMSNLLT